MERQTRRPAAFPSRITGTRHPFCLGPRLILRQTVLYSAACPTGQAEDLNMTLSTEQVQQFKEQGYTLAPGFFNDREVQALRTELDRFIQEGLLRNVCTDGDGKTHSQTRTNLQICPIWSKSRLFRAVPFAPKSIAALEQLIGGPIIQHLDQIFLKPAHSGAPTNWHQDNAYFKITNPLRGTAMWIALHDATAANGTMRIIPDFFPAPRLSIAAIPTATTTSVAGPMNPKPCSVNCPPAASPSSPTARPIAPVPIAPNTTAPVSALHFMTVDQAAPELLAEPRDCRPYLTGPKATGGLAEYGKIIDWDKEIEQKLTGCQPVRPPALEKSRADNYPRVKLPVIAPVVHFHCNPAPSRRSWRPPPGVVTCNRPPPSSQRSWCGLATVTKHASSRRSAAAQIILRSTGGGAP